MTYYKILVGVSIAVSVLVFILFAAGSEAIIVLKVIYCLAFAICFGGGLKALHRGSSIYRALPPVLLGLVVFDAGTAFFIEKRNFLDAWYIIYPVGAVAVLALIFIVIFSSKLLCKLNNKS